jgi:septal ring factor EnvC (AmiA/AmiB activator)
MSKSWQISTLIAGTVAVGTIAYALSQHSEVLALTAQLGAISSQLASANADLKETREKADSLSAQLAASTSEAQQAHAQTAEVQAKANVEQQQLETTQARLASEARPDLPVSISFRKALLSQGLVGVLRNNTNRELEFTLDLESPATGKHVRKAVVLNPNSFVEIGTAQGWAFAPGQHIILNNPAYRPMLRTVT